MTGRKPTGEIYALEFAANIGKWQIKGIDIIKFDDVGQMIEFGVLIRLVEALAALGEGKGEPDWPATERDEGGRRYQALIMALFGGLRTAPALAPLEALWQGSARSVAALLGRFSCSGHAAVAQW